MGAISKNDPGLTRRVLVWLVCLVGVPVIAAAVRSLAERTAITSLEAGVVIMMTALTVGSLLAALAWTRRAVAAAEARGVEEAQRRRVYSEIVASVQVGIVVYKLEGEDASSLRLVMCNAAASAATGTPVGALIGLPIFAAFPALAGTTIAEAFAQVARTGHGMDLGETRYGDERVADSHYAVKAFPLSDRCVGVAFENITTRKLAEEATRRANLAAQAANQELESFSYSVSHDLRAPLRSIDGFSLALLEDYEGALDEHGKDYLRRVRAATQRMGKLIDDLLELARVSRLELRKQDVDVSAVAADLVRELRAAEPERQVEVTIAPGLRVKGDPVLVRVALDNIISNAWKFTSKKARARIEVGRSDGAALFVKDDGVGFDPAYAARLFGAFQRLHGAAEFPGTGVGLATVKRVVLRHGGRVWAEAQPDRGATFFFTFEPRDDA